MIRSYMVNEVFLSVQGEGARAGTSNVFVRFAGCNLTCAKDGEAGFDCDTEFRSHSPLSAAEIIAVAREKWGPTGRDNQRISFILTGGEPLLQVDTELLAALEPVANTIAIETNGTQKLPELPTWFNRVMWVSCSPKTAEHTLRVATSVDELRYVRHEGQGIPRPVLQATHHFLSPAWDVDAAQTRRNVDWCMRLVHENPQWRLSVQMHKLWQVR